MTIWVRVSFITLMSLALYSILGSVLVWTTTARPPFLIMLGALFLLRVPYLYWSMRGRYALASGASGANRPIESLVYRGEASVNRLVKVLGPTVMAVFGNGAGWIRISDQLRMQSLDLVLLGILRERYVANTNPRSVSSRRHIRGGFFGSTLQHPKL